MVTGDNIYTAKTIAKACNIIEKNEEDALCIEGY